MLGEGYCHPLIMVKVLDLFCGAGGASFGYYKAGFDVVGIDINEQRNYPMCFEFIQDDALEVLKDKKFINKFDLIHASPPCQAYSKTKALHSNTHPDLVEKTRELLLSTGKPYVIENVERAPLIPELSVTLCGAMEEFGLRARDIDGVELKMFRHRVFENNWGLRQPEHLAHKFVPGITATVYGQGGGWTPEWRDNPQRTGGYIPHTMVVEELMQIEWMNKHQMSQAVPPAYTKYVGLGFVTASKTK